jgi:hypothetical protein
MKLLQIVPREGTRLYGAIIKKQAEIRRSGRGTFSRARARKRKAARWTHVRYKGSVNLEPGLSEAVEVAITSAATRRGCSRHFSAGSIAISASSFRPSTFSINTPRQPVVVADAGLLELRRR